MGCGYIDGAGHSTGHNMYLRQRQGPPLRTILQGLSVKGVRGTPGVNYPGKYLPYTVIWNVRAVRGVRAESLMCGG